MTISSRDFDYLRKLVQQHSAVVLDTGKEYLVELYLKPLTELMGFNSISSLVNNLRDQPFNNIHVQVIESLINYETSFFRDHHPFEALKNSVLPELIKLRTVERSINIWSAACSSGQEPYSIAILIKEHFPILSSWKVRLIASDFSSKILERAIQGRYNQFQINRGLSKPLQTQYFKEHNNQWQINENIRQMIEFRQINLVQSLSSLPQMDVVFLRNILIYFNTEMKKNILGKIQKLLKPNGYLFLGGSETTIKLDSSFQQVQSEKSIYYQFCPLDD